MIDFILELHRRIYTSKLLLPNQGQGTLPGKFRMVFVVSLRFLFNAIIKVKQPTYSENRKVDEKTIISFTSFPARINAVHFVVISLLRQTILPYKILLVLSEENFPNKEKDLPLPLRRITSGRFEIVWVKDDIKPHKKYYYALQKYSDFNIVTVDDDLFYRKDLLERLLGIHAKHPQCVCANNIHNITFENNGIAPYFKWGRTLKYDKEVSHSYLAIGYGGVLYPAHIFDGADVLNVKAIKETCLRADDLWLKSQEVLANVPVAIEFSCYSAPICLSQTQETTLCSTNACKDQISENDNQFDKIDQRYNFKNKLIKLYREECIGQ